MLIPWIERTIGANWRTTLSGILTTLLTVAVALAAMPPDIWKDWRVSVPAVLALLAKTATDLTTKDARVTGGTVLQGSAHLIERRAGQPEDTLP